MSFCQLMPFSVGESRAHREQMNDALFRGSLAEERAIINEGVNSPGLNRIESCRGISEATMSDPLLVKEVRRRSAIHDADAKRA